MDTYVCIITVTVEAPKGYKPRRKEYVLTTVSESGRYGEEEKSKFLDYVKRKYEESSIKITLKFSASSVTYKTNSLRVDNALLKKTSQNPDNSKE
jgi:3-hydroxyacyl-CoA dehydrogenase